MTLQDTLIAVWRQALADSKSSVTLDGRRYPIQFTRAKRLRTVTFSYGRRQIFGVEQNPKTESRWAMLARQGKRIMQFSSEGRYFANVCEGELLRYPAWKTLKLPE